MSWDIDRGVHFKFLKGGDGEFVFKWTESHHVSIWAPAIQAADSHWEKQKQSTDYWHDLRTELLRVLPGGIASDAVN